MIHEQNVIPGMTTKFLSSRVDKVLISFKESMQYFKDKNNLFYTGVPVRSAFYHVEREKVREELGLFEEDIFVISLGGSNGAKVINDLSKTLIDEAEKRPGVYYTHITGRRFYKTYIESLASEPSSKRITILDYTDDIHNLLGAADLVISRAGALSLAEFKALSLRAVLIPSPNVADDHQFHNAKSFEKSGCSMLLKESDYTISELVEKVLTLIDQPEQIDNMRGNYAKQNGEDALNTIMSMIFNYSLR